MSTAVQQDIDVLLGVNGAVPSPARRDNFNAVAVARAEIDDSQIKPFSPFLAESLEEAMEIFEGFDALAKNMESDGASHEEIVAAVTDRAAELSATHNVQLVRYALMLFMTHNASGRTVRIPSLMRRTFSLEIGDLQAAGDHPHIGGATTSPEENKLNWFREDPLANEHHQHWHLVYPNRRREWLKERHGELFFYMHEQMLARYDSERIAAGLPRVEPYDDFSVPIEVGYDAGALAIDGATYAPRRANLLWQNLPAGSLGPTFPGYSVATHASQQDMFETAVTSQQLLRGGNEVPLSGKDGSDKLGDAIESSVASVSSSYGNHHGFGHVLTAFLDNAPQSWGVMANPACAIRDPFFWQWHKYIDSVNGAYQNTQPSHDLSDAPNVTIGEDGLSLLNRDGEMVTELTTELRLGVFRFTSGDSFAYDYLWHEDFSYQLNLTNHDDTPKNVTVRLFLCPREAGASLDDDSMLNDRTLWIEMDKFSATLPGQAETHLLRSDKDSSVIRRPAEEPTDIVDISPLPGHPDDFMCECGWPYHMLVPRGTEDGMAFALMAMITDGDIDHVPDQSECGSMSYCGLKDKYPDERPMGYPFDRPLSAPLGQILSEQSNMQLMDITIRTKPSDNGANV